MENEEFIKKYDNKERFSDNELSRLVWEMNEVDEIRGENRRWSQSVETIFEVEGRYFSLMWENGLTEMQENEFYDQPVEVELVEKVVTKTVKNWVPKENK